MQKFTENRKLTAGENEDWQIDMARSSAFKEAHRRAMRAYGGEGSLPQDHVLDETVSPDDEGGTVVTVTITLP